MTDHDGVNRLALLLLLVVQHVARRSAPSEDLARASYRMITQLRKRLVLLWASISRTFDRNNWRHL